MIFRASSWRSSQAFLLADVRFLPSIERGRSLRPSAARGEQAGQFLRLSGRARLPMVNVDDARYVSAAQQRHPQKRFIRVLHQRRKPLEARILRRTIGKSDNCLVLRHPASDAFANLDADVSNFGGVRQLRRPESHLAAYGLQQIDETCFTLSNIDRQTNQLAEHLLQCHPGADDFAGAMQNAEL